MRASTAPFLIPRMLDVGSARRLTIEPAATAYRGGVAERSGPPW
jgi:hypothetical protein